MAGVVLLSSAARTTSGSGSAVGGLGDRTTLRVQLDVTAASGTSPTLNVQVEDTLDGTNWNAVGAFTQKVAAGREVVSITTPFTDQVRVSWTVGGTSPSFTFSVLGYVE